MSVAARLALAMTLMFFAAGEAAAQCRLHGSGLNFGIHRSTRVSTSTGTITVDCAPGIPFHIELSEGDGSFANRRLRGDRGGTLEYNLFTTPTYSRIWGDGVTPGTHTVGGAGQGRPQVFTVYGRIPAGQRPTPGVYADTLTVTVSF